MHVATGGWTDDWLWGLSLIVSSVVMHVFGLAMIGTCLVKVLPFTQRRATHPLVVFSVAIGFAALLLALLHGVEASLWGATLVWLGAVTDFRSAIYFSLQMATTLGANVVQLEERWKLMGPLEAISGMLLFGLSTAFLLVVAQRVSPFARSGSVLIAAKPSESTERAEIN